MKDTKNKHDARSTPASEPSPEEWEKACLKACGSHEKSWTYEMFRTGALWEKKASDSLREKLAKAKEILADGAETYSYSQVHVSFVNRAINALEEKP